MPWCCMAPYTDGADLLLQKNLIKVGATGPGRCCVLIHAGALQCVLMPVQDVQLST
jgi:hypothetical protein